MRRCLKTFSLCNVNMWEQRQVTGVYSYKLSHCSFLLLHSKSEKNTASASSPQASNQKPHFPPWSSAPWKGCWKAGREAAGREDRPLGCPPNQPRASLSQDCPWRSNMISYAFSPPNQDQRNGAGCC